MTIPIGSRTTGARRSQDRDSQCSVSRPSSPEVSMAAKNAGEAKAKPASATHLAASMRVVASHLHMRRVTIDTAREAVVDAARRAKAGRSTPENEVLVDRLEKVTGASISELSKAAERWKEV